ncbi:MAG: hypothetical protein M1821_002474 [Bathelium mastoideum]|nr:MAG: hypothetical protein M1821_002474 [Bathelium mastoideum]
MNTNIGISLISSGLFLQTPQDDSAFFSFSAQENATSDEKRTFTGFLIASESEIWDVRRSADKGISHIFQRTEVPIIKVPLILLKRYIEQTCTDRTELTKLVEQVEKTSTEDLRGADLSQLISDVAKANKDLIRLERRWHFESNALSWAHNLMNRYKSDATEGEVRLNRLAVQDEGLLNIQRPPNVSSIHVIDSCIRGKGTILIRGPLQDNAPAEPGIESSRDFRELRSEVDSLRRLSQTSKYDLSVLPRRIENQFTAVSRAPAILHAKR